MVTEDKNARGHIVMLAVNILFGLNLIIGKFALGSGDVTPHALTFYRVVGAAILFWIASLFVPSERVGWQDMIKLFLASLFGIQINQMFFITGLSMTSPINASIIAAMVPMITMIIAALYLKEPITWKKAVGVLVGASGAIMLIMSSKAVAGASSGNIKGDLLCLVSACSYAVYLTVFRDTIRRYRPITLMKWLFLFAAIACFPFGYQDVSAELVQNHSVELLLQIGYIVFFATFVTYLLIPIGQKTLRPTIVSMYNYVQPLVAAVVAVMWGLDTFGWQKSVACLLVFLGVYLATRSKSRAQIEAEKQ